MTTGSRKEVLCRNQKFVFRILGLATNLLVKAIIVFTVFPEETDSCHEQFCFFFSVCKHQVFQALNKYVHKEESRE